MLLLPHRVLLKQAFPAMTTKALRPNFFPAMTTEAFHPNLDFIKSTLARIEARCDHIERLLRDLYCGLEAKCYFRRSKHDVV